MVRTATFILCPESNVKDKSNNAGVEILRHYLFTAHGFNRHDKMPDYPIHAP